MKIFKIAIVLLFFSVSLFSEIEDYSLSSQTYINSNIKILDTKLLNFPHVHGISALAYEDGKLYALSDRGVLYLFNLILADDKINKLSLCERYVLTNTKGKVLKKKKCDSEGLCFYKDGLLISFERKNRVLYCSRKAKKIKKLRLNTLLENNANYQSPNKGLESVSYSKRYGLITIPEKPLKNVDKRYHTLYSKDNRWSFTAKGSVTDIEFIDTTHVLVLLRKFHYITRQRMTALVEVDLEDCNKHRVCKSELLIKLDSDKGWKIDNFEGLTKVGKNKFLMVSDDNDSFFQKTLLVLFEIKN